MSFYRLLNKLLAASACALLLVTSSQAVTHQNVITEDCQVFVPKQHRARNRTGIQCVWASLECLARIHGIEKASHLTDRYKHTAGPGDVRMILKSYGVDYRMSLPGRRDKEFLKTCCANGWGACVGLGGAHMINVIHYKDGKVKVIDNSDSQLRVQTWTEERFLQMWDGWAVALVPPEKWVY